jgi:hypothetical protein
VFKDWLFLVSTPINKLSQCCLTTRYLNKIHTNFFRNTRINLVYQHTTTTKEEVNAVNIVIQTAEGKFIVFEQEKYAIPGKTLSPVGGFG